MITGAALQANFASKVLLGIWDLSSKPGRCFYKYDNVMSQYETTFIWFG